MSLVYSYLRFSSARQATGTSIDRQLEYARRWAAENGMTLDESLTMRDEGLSAFHGRHIKSGALGIFLAAIDAGTIPPGSVLIIEGLDRLSRAEPLQAQAILTQIINAEITVVTAADDGASPMFFVRKARDLEAALAEARKDIAMKIGRNAGNGRFTTVKQAQNAPKTHVVETIKQQPAKPARQQTRKK